MENNLKKITLTFDLDDQRDKALWNKLSDIWEKTNICKNDKITHKAEVIKRLIRPISQKELMNLQIELLSYQDRIEIWRLMHEQSKEVKLEKDKFIVEELPKLKEKYLHNLEKKYFENKNKGELSNVQST